VTELFTQRAHDCAGFGTARTFDLGNAGSALEAFQAWARRRQWTACGPKATARDAQKERVQDSSLYNRTHKSGSDVPGFLTLKRSLPVGTGTGIVRHSDGC
jgi:hypothetical protein